MNPLVKNRWIQALLSDNYEQDFFYLRTERGFCYLGVLCDLYSHDHNEQWVETKDGVFVFMQEISNLPPAVRTWAQYDSNQLIDYNEEKLRIAMIGDLYQLPFKDIASIIDSQL